MRWDVLIQDLSDRFDYLSRQNGTDMVPDLVRAERASITLLHRLLGSVNCDVVVTCHGGGSVSGELTQVRANWLLVAERTPARLSSIIPLSSIQSVQGLGSQVVQSDDSTPGGLTFLAVLRQLGQSRLPVTLALGATAVSGYIAAVGRDWLDLRSREKPEQVTTYRLEHLDFITNRAARTLQ